MNYLTAKVLLCVCVGGGGRVYTNTTESLILKIIWLYRYAFGIRLGFFFHRTNVTLSNSGVKKKYEFI